MLVVTEIIHVVFILGICLFVNIARLTETVHYQFILRGYGQFKPSLLLRKKWNLVDYLAIIITFLVIIIAIIPWSRISHIFSRFVV